MISALFARFAPYMVATLGVAVVVVGLTAWGQSARLEAAQQESLRIQGERDAALGANEKLAEAAKREAWAAAELTRSLQKLRGQYEELSANLRAVSDDGCLDRNHPADVGRLFVDEGRARPDRPADSGVLGTAPRP